MRDAGIATYGPSGVGYDGSGIEVRTPVLQGDEGFAHLTRMMDFLHEIGCYVTKSDGMHVHVGAAELNTDEEACKVLARIWYHNQELIGKMVSDHRFGNVIMGTHVCAKVTQDEAETWGQSKKTTRVRDGQAGGTRKTWGPRYKALSMYRVPHRKTVEFRLHEGCLDPKKAIPWIKFCQGIVDHAVTKREVITCKSKTSLLRELEIPEDAISVLARAQKQMPVSRTERVYRA